MILSDFFKLYKGGIASVSISSPGKAYFIECPLEDVLDSVTYKSISRKQVVSFAIIGVDMASVELSVRICK